MFEKETLKLLPCGARKKKIFKWYPMEPEKNFRILIHAIQIESNPHLSAKGAKNRKHLSRKELKKIVDIIGPPEGYSENFK